VWLGFHFRNKFRMMAAALGAVAAYLLYEKKIRGGGWSEVAAWCGGVE
jgi:hypothetical protein